MSKREDKIKITSPAGIARYPRLNTPSTKFNPAGVYEVELVLEDDKPENEKFRQRIEALEAQSHADAKATLAVKKKRPILADSVIKPVLDDEGNEVPGQFKIRAKMVASGLRKADNSPWTMKPAIFDAKGKPSQAKVGGGSTIKVCIEVRPYLTPKGEAGISLRLEAVQVIDLVEYSGGQEASSYGFGQEDGYEDNGSPETPDETPAEDTPADEPAPEEKPAASTKRTRGSF